MQHWSFPHTLLSWLKLIFTSSLEWTQLWRDGTFVVPLPWSRMRRKNRRGFHKWLSGMFPTPLQLLVEVHSCTRGLFWRKCNLNDCSVLYFSEIKWFQKHFEAVTYTANNPNMMYYETLSTAPPCIVPPHVSFTYYSPYKSDIFKTVCNHLLHTFLTFFLSTVRAETMDRG